MVRIPTPSEGGVEIGTVQEEVRQTPFYNVTPADTSFGAKQLMQFGETLQILGTEITERRKDTALRNAEREYNEWTREILDPQSGIFAQRQGNAAGVTDYVNQSFEQKRAEIMEKYSGGIGRSGKQALEEFLEGAGQRVWKSAASHELEQLTRYETEQSKALIEDQIDRATLLYADPDEVSASLLNIENLSSDLADNLGMSPAAARQFVQENTSQAIGMVVSRIGDTNPEVADQLISRAEQAGKLDPSEALVLKEQLKPKLLRYRATEDANIAKQIASGQPLTPEMMGNHQTSFDFNLGAERPLKPDAPILNVVGTAAERVWGPGARVEVYSGKDDDTQYGSNRHGTGVAVDIRIYRPDGSKVRVDDPDAAEFMKQASVHGALGIGAGREYMGDHGFHVDLVPPDPAKRQDNEWGSIGNSMKAELAAARAEGEMMRKFATPEAYFESIADPEQRMLAMELYDQQLSRQFTNMSRASSQAADVLYTQLYEAYQADPTAPNPLQTILSQNPGMSAVLGRRLSEVQSYADQLFSTGNVATVPEAKAYLHELAKTDMVKFAETDLTADFRSRLNDDDFADLQEIQQVTRDMLTGRSELMPYADVARITRSSLEDLGLDTDETDSVNAKVSRWVQSYVAENKQLPSAFAIKDQAKLFAGQSAAGGEADIASWGRTGYTLPELQAEVLDYGGVDFLLSDPAAQEIKLNVPMSSGRNVEINIKPDDVQQAIKDFAAAFGYKPSSDQIIELIIMGYSDRDNPRPGF